jgi:hypothetical protein
MLWTAPTPCPRRPGARGGDVPCTPVALPDGARAIVCTRGASKRARCSVCGARTTHLCDAPLPGGGTCSATLCAACRVVQPGGADFCPSCAAAAERALPAPAARTPERPQPRPPVAAGGGQWNAYVERAADPAERAARLAACPAHLRAEVAGHVETILALRRAVAARRSTAA